MNLEQMSDWMQSSMPGIGIDKRFKSQQSGENDLIGAISGDTAARPFSGIVERAVNAIQGPAAAARNVIDKFSRGAEGEIHESMMALEKSDIGTKFFVTAKNKAIEAYKEIMRMG